MDCAIVTGHSRGLGAAVAAELLQRGWQVLGLARHANEELQERFGTKLTQRAIDLADGPGLAAWAQGETLQRFLVGAERALLVNNAGRLRPVRQPGRQGPCEVERTVTVNVTAPLVLSDAFLAATCDVRDRRIVHVSSGAARTPYAGWSIYCATKAALDMHARATALDGVRGLAIESLAPGVIDTAMQAEVREADPAEFPLRPRFESMKRSGQLTPPGEAAARFVDYVLSERFGQEPASDIRAVGG